MADENSTEFAKNTFSTGAKGPRPAEVGPHDPNAAVQDPGKRPTTPEEKYKPGAQDQGGTAGPGTPGKAPVNIMPKDAEGSGGAPADDQATGQGKAGIGRLAEE